MDSRRKLAIGEWIDAPIRHGNSTRSARLYGSTGVIGVIGTVFIHSLVLFSALSGIQAHRSRLPENPMLGSTLEKVDSAPSDALVLVELPVISKDDREAPTKAAAARSTVNDAPIAAIRPDPSPMLDIDTMQIDTSQELASQPSLDSGNGAELARLFGLYSGQIQARIERLWRRPRTPVNRSGDAANNPPGIDYFQCQAQIVQDSHGNVLEVLLPRCNGSLAWQHSLVSAIQQSSPLPAPPNPKVFTQSILLNFVGYAYTKDSSDDEYEIAPVRTAQTDVHQ